jgi:hypothetical protein
VGLVEQVVPQFQQRFLPQLKAERVARAAMAVLI